MPGKLALVMESWGQISQMGSGDFLNLGKLNIGSGVTVTAATSIILPNSSHILLNNTGGSTVNVDYINGGNDGDIIFLRLAAGSSDVRVRKGNGNIYGGPNRLFGDMTDILMLASNGVAWGEVSWQG